MKTIILSIGDELILGQIADTNAAWLSERLVERGIVPEYHQAVPDNLAAIVQALKLAAGRADLIIVTGGIGPTPDDLTRQALAAAALSRREVGRIILTRPAVEAGEKLGFLPGDIAAKVDPYLRPLFDAMHDMLDADRAQQYLERGQIEVAPIAFMRGRTLAHAFVIVDEAQNCSRLQMKMVLTRLGEGSRMVVTGDPTQIDLLNPRDSGLAHAVSILEGVEGVSVSRFTAADVVRHPLVERIVKAYDADAAQSTPR